MLKLLNIAFILTYFLITFKIKTCHKVLCPISLNVLTVPNSSYTFYWCSFWIKKMLPLNHSTKLFNKKDQAVRLGSNPFHPNISSHILHTVLYTFPKWWQGEFVLLAIKSFFSLWSFPLFSWPSCVNQGWYCREKLDAGHP